MTSSTSTTTPPAPPRRSGPRRAIIVGAAFAATILVVGSFAALGTRGGGDRGAPVIAEGSVAWVDIDVRREGTSGRSSIDATVRHSGLEGSDAAPGSAYVLFQLDRGRFDDLEHVDAARAERALGMEHDENILIVPTAGMDVDENLVPSASYSPSTDGTISYRDIPEGTYELKAIVIKADGTWDGTNARRTVTVD